ncbi:hypothetical protein B484DRAFT_416409, partial [Ochromonadaceae sp. CCMP2298]
MLEAANVPPSALPAHLLSVYQQMVSEEGRAAGAAQRARHEAEAALTAYDLHIGSGLALHEARQLRSAAEGTPSEGELQVDKQLSSDGKYAKDSKYDKYAAEKYDKYDKYVDRILYAVRPRPRPVVLLLSRDLSAHAKRRIREQVTAMMPGLFVNLGGGGGGRGGGGIGVGGSGGGGSGGWGSGGGSSNRANNMGVDIEAMQRVLDCGQCIMMEVDAGLTRSTREVFLARLGGQLAPRPVVAMAMGDEGNRCAYTYPYTYPYTTYTDTYTDIPYVSAASHTSPPSNTYTDTDAHSPADSVSYADEGAEGAEWAARWGGRAGPVEVSGQGVRVAEVGDAYGVGGGDAGGGGGAGWVVPPGDDKHGVDLSDLRSMVDGDVKAALQFRALAAHQLSRPHMVEIMLQRAALATPPSAAIVLVTEAFFLTFEEIHKVPNLDLAGMSWRVTRTLLANPRQILEKMGSFRRGASGEKVASLQLYL